MRILLDRFSYLAFVLLLLLSADIFGQTKVGDIVAKAAEQRKEYISEFANLMAEETKTFEVFDKKGLAKKRRSIVSNFIVYRLEKDPNNIAEYRNVVSVDGKQIDDGGKRAQKFFEEITHVTTSKKELEKIEDEGSRFDEEISLNQFTLYQSPALADNLRPYFDFKFERTEKLDGREVVVVSFQQIKDCPCISTDIKTEAVNGMLTLIYDVDYQGAKELNGRLQGKFWLDARTFQVWKEHRVMTVRPKGFSAPAIFAENTLEYQPSTFGILTPKRISYLQFRIDRKGTGEQKEAGVTFEYGNFTKPDVEVKSADVKNRN